MRKMTREVKKDHVLHNLSFDKTQASIIVSQHLQVVTVVAVVAVTLFPYRDIVTATTATDQWLANIQSMKLISNVINGCIVPHHSASPSYSTTGYKIPWRTKTAAVAQHFHDARDRVVSDLAVSRSPSWNNRILDYGVTRKSGSSI
jgi:hypothetical protein